MLQDRCWSSRKIKKFFTPFYFRINAAIICLANFLNPCTKFSVKEIFSYTFPTLTKNQIFWMKIIFYSYSEAFFPYSTSFCFSPYSPQRNFIMFYALSGFSYAIKKLKFLSTYFLLTFIILKIVWRLTGFFFDFITSKR